MNEYSQLIVLILGILVIILIYLYSTANKNDVKNKEKINDLQNQIIQMQNKISNLAHDQYNQWRIKDLEKVQSEEKALALREANNTLQQWKIEYETQIRQDAINRSQAVITGKVVEHLVPYMSIFPFNPKDAKFIGSPIDLIVFDGLDMGELLNVIFLEVKTNKSSLTTRQKQIKDAIMSGRVLWRELKVNI